MSNVKLTQTIDDREVVKAFQKQNQLLEKLSRNLDRVGKKGGQAGKQTKREFASATGSALKFAAAITGVGSVVGAIGVAARQLNAELANIRSRQREAANAQLSVAQFQRDALLNFGGKRGAQLNKAANAIAEQTGASRIGVFRAISTAASFKGASISDKFAFNAVREAARIQPDNPDAIVTIAQGILAQKKRSTGTAKQIAGFQLGIKRLSPVASDEEFAKNIATGIPDQVALGNTPEQSGALLAALGQSIGDPTGRVTRTAAINLSKQLQIALPNVPGGTFGRLNFIRSPAGAKVRSRLLGPLQRSLRKTRQHAQGAGVGISTEAKSFATVIDLLQAQSNPTQQLFAQTLAAVPQISGSGQFLDSQLAGINKQALQQTTEFKRRLVAGKERLRLSDIREGRVGIGRDELRGLLKASGSSSIDQTISGLQFDFSTASGTVPVDEVIAQLRERARILRSSTGGPTTLSVSPGAPPPGFQGGAVPLPTKSASAKDLQTAAILSQIADTLRSIDGKTQPAQQQSRPPASKSLSRN